MLYPEYLFEDPKPLDVFMSQVTAIVPAADGSPLFARVMKPFLNAPDEKRPAIIMMHGFPGYEKWIEVAQALKRMGCVTVTSAFRGVWGCGGNYTLTGLADDARAHVEYCKAHADELNIDPDHIYLFGHSMGGFTALRLMAEGIDVKGVVLVAPCDMVEKYQSDKAGFKTMVEGSCPFFTLDEKGGAVFEEECKAHPITWHLDELAKKADPSIPVLMFAGGKDDLCPPASHAMPAYSVLKQRGFDVTYLLFDSDHCFQSAKVEFTRSLAEWLVAQEEK